MLASAHDDGAGEGRRWCHRDAHEVPRWARLTLVAHDEREPITLSLDDEAAILAGIAEIRAGRGIPVARVRAKLRRRA